MSGKKRSRASSSAGICLASGNVDVGGGRSRLSLGSSARRRRARSTSSASASASESYSSVALKGRPLPTAHSWISARKDGGGGGGGTKCTAASRSDNCGRNDDGGGSGGISGVVGGRISEVESLTLRLSNLESKRDEKRRLLERRFEEMQAIRREINGMEGELQELDEEIEGVEGKLRRAVDASSRMVKSKAEDAVGERSSIRSGGGGGRRDRPPPTRDEEEKKGGEDENGGALQILDEGDGDTVGSGGVGGNGPFAPTLTCQPDEILTDPRSPIRSPAGGGGGGGGGGNDDIFGGNAGRKELPSSPGGSLLVPLPPPSPPPLRPPRAAAAAARPLHPPDDDIDDADIEDHYADQEMGGITTMEEPDTPSIVDRYEAEAAEQLVAAPCAPIADADDDENDSPLPPGDDEEVEGTPHRTSLGRVGYDTGVGGGDDDGGMIGYDSDAAFNASADSGGREASAVVAAQDPPFLSSATWGTEMGAGRTYPWTDRVLDLLRNVFRILSFRDHQREIIDCTLSGRDAFVIMRTGGGKSLTYQLPALLEGRHAPERKVTVVISPLLSLIHDQEEQMNGFCARSATSFTSGLPGGQAEHARRWGRVRDPDGGVCLILVTPEKVHKSGKLKTELRKLHEAGRLGRFVIDECHCACQWGHDFRPDYTELGALKSMFPDVPLIAVTATASDNVREDVAHILRIGRNYQLFRSSFDRPNLRYSVRVKADGGRKVVEEMADFIQTKHAQAAGIVYTLSRKDADEVADILCDCGIVARPYHSDVSNRDKERVHRSWMRNETQVVVATIAFGLGINKPDVRFVLHHSVSKSLEAYYQESGRAGRDGQPADCVLYYSPRDVSRIVCMIHGEHGEKSFWSMVRYAQASGNDALCRAIIMSTLGELGTPNVDELVKRGCSETEVRDVGLHSQVVAKMVLDATNSTGRRRKAKDDLTLSKAVAAWRSKEPNHQYIKDYPPGNDLTKDECERIVISLLVVGVLSPKIVSTKYGSTMYLRLGRDGLAFAHSTNPHAKIHFPKRKARVSAVSAATRRRSSAGNSVNAKADSSGWIQRKSCDPMLDAGRKGTGRSARMSKTKSSRNVGCGGKSIRGSVCEDGSRLESSIVVENAFLGSEVIELDMSSSSGCEDASPIGRNGRKRLARAAKGGAIKKMKTMEPDFFEDSGDNLSDFG